MLFFQYPPDSFAVAEASEEDEEYMSCLNLTGDGMMGYVEIPKINIKICFHTTGMRYFKRQQAIWKGVPFPLEERAHMLLSLLTEDCQVLLCSQILTS